MNPVRTPLSASTQRPFLVQERPFARPRHSLLELWHLLSLDAPTAAALWTAWIGWCAGVPPRPVDVAAMFAAVWILYATDRLLDARPLFTEAYVPELRERHHFHHRYRSRFLAALLLVCPVLLVLLHFTADTLLHLYVLLAVLLAGWLILVHAQSHATEAMRRLPKELVVGPFFAVAVCLPTIAKAPQIGSSLVPFALLLALLCSLNCLFLYAWEHGGNDMQANPATRWALRHLLRLATAVPLLGSLFWFFAIQRPRALWLGDLPHAGLCFAALSLSAGLLLWLHHRHRELPPLVLRSLADLVLLTPIPFALGLLAWQRLL